MKPPRAEVFEATYRHYLEQLGRLDYLARAELLGVEAAEGRLKIPLYDRLYLVDHRGIVAVGGEPLTPAIRVIICKYLLTCPAELPQMSSRLMAFRDFKDAGPLVAYFGANASRVVESTFAGDREALKRRGLAVGGRLRQAEGYDLSLEFYALPRIPVVLNFNDQDEMFGAKCSLLYRSSAAHFLDMECLAMTGPLLAEKLVSGSLATAATA